MNRFQSIGTIVALCFIASIFGCDELACAEQTGADPCAAAYEAHGARHDHPLPSSASHTHECICVCHVPVILTVADVPVPVAAISTTALPYSADIAAAPRASIFHPPLAS